MHAVILAGGKGTRLRPLTDTRPKPLVPFMGEPFAAGLLRRLAEVGCHRATFLIADDPTPFEVLEVTARPLGITVAASTEEVPLDTAGAARRLLRASEEDEPVLVCNGDILTDLDLEALLSTHAEAGARATIALTRVEDTSTFGVVECDGQGRVQRFVEKPAPGTLAADTVNAGTYVLSPDVFEGFPGDGPLSFERAVFPGLLEQGAIVIGHAAEAFWADLGTPQRYLDGTRAVLERRCDWPPAPGMVTVGTAAMAHDEAEVEGAELSEGVVVGAGCRVAPGVHLRDTVLFDDVEIDPDVTCDGAIIGQGARIGRGAQLGRGTVVGDGVRIPRGQKLP
jgi:mannose-1-phosphate guanylyltransferase